MMTDQQIRKVNDAVGKEAFERLDKVLTEEGLTEEFCALLEEGKVDLHRDGFLGFTVVENGVGSNEGWEI